MFIGVIMTTDASSHDKDTLKWIYYKSYVTETGVESRTT